MQAIFSACCSVYNCVCVYEYLFGLINCALFINRQLVMGTQHPQLHGAAMQTPLNFNGQPNCKQTNAKHFISIMPDCVCTELRHSNQQFVFKQCAWRVRIEALHLCMPDANCANDLNGTKEWSKLGRPTATSIQFFNKIGSIMQSSDQSTTTTCMRRIPYDMHAIDKANTPPSINSHLIFPIKSTGRTSRALAK